MHLPHFRTGVTLVIEYEIVEGRNVVTHVPTVAGSRDLAVARLRRQGPATAQTQVGA